MRERFCIVTTTLDDPVAAQKITQTLLQERLAACIQQQQIQSSYRWQGALESSEEIRLEIKTRTALFPQVKARILALHPYDLPEIIAVAITDAHSDYLEWIRDETSR